MKASHGKILIDLLSLPTSPFNEHLIVDYVRGWAAKRPAIEMTRDGFGNVRLRLRRGRRRVERPVVLTAHMDHPGFEAERMVGRRRLRAIWRGGVAPEYFPGTAVRFYGDGDWVRGTLRAADVVCEDGRRRVDSAVVEVSRPVAAGSIGMWDLPDPAVRGSRIYARACDDVAGVAAVLAALDDLHRGGDAVDVYALFTRAEEVGFAGAIAACRSGLLPERGRLVAVECSSEIPGVRMGCGPILRVGDRMSIFTPGLTAWCRHVADDLARRDRGFTYQRRLMDGGTCESSVFCEYGWEATGLCLALGNYHNMDRRRRRIASEHIDAGDFSRLIKWFTALARPTERPSTRGHTALRRSFERLGRRWSAMLKDTAEGF